MFEGHKTIEQKTSLNFKGFSKIEKKNIQEILELLGFNLSYVSTISKMRVGKGFVSSGIGGSYNERNGVLKIAFDSLIIDNPSGQPFFEREVISNLVHELTHAQSATQTAIKNSQVPKQSVLRKYRFQEGYGSNIFSEEESRYFAESVNNFRDQSARTRVYLDPYHHGLEEHRMSVGEKYGDFDVAVEVEAILLTLYLTDPSELMEIEKKQRAALGENKDFISPTELAEKLLMHITGRSIDEVRGSRDVFLKRISSR